MRARVTDFVDFPLLEHAQQLDLQEQRQLADFIQEDRPAVGQLELPLLVGRRARERPATVPEQLGFKQVFRNRRTVDDDERTAGPLAV